MINGKKTFAAVIILLFLSSIAAVQQPATAHTPSWNIPTYAYLAASPNTVAVGQYTLLIMWLNTVVPTSGGTSGDAWRNFKIDVTDPDGQKTTLGPFTSGQVGTTFTTFTPTKVGVYTMVFSWPGQTLSNGTGEPNFRGLAYVGDFFQPSTSAPLTLTVTQNPVASFPETPLPTEYWTRPINDLNRNWSPLASNWLGGAWLNNRYQTAGQAPNSPHVVWTLEQASGGIGDAQWPGIPYNVHDYDNPFSAPIIMNGKVYINGPVTGATDKYGYSCVDLRTGELLWAKNGTDNGLNNAVSLVGYASGLNTAPALSQTFPQLSFGQIYQYYSVNGHGLLPYLWMTSGSNWYMLDADTGNWIMTLKNVPGGTAAIDQDGSLLRYSYNTNTGNLLCWNSSQSIPPAGPTGTSQQQWKPRNGATIDAVNDTSWVSFGAVANQWDAIDTAARSGYTMNLTIAKGLPVAPPSLTGGLPSPGAGSLIVVQDENRVTRYILGFRNWDAVASTTGGSGTFAAWAVQINYNAAPYSPNPDKTYTQNNNLGMTANLLYNLNYSNPIPGNLTYSIGPVDYNSKIFTVFSKETMQWWGYSLLDGHKVWGPSTPEPAWNMYGDESAVANGNLYTCGYAGVLSCYNIATGELKWTYTASNIGFESPYGNYPLSIGGISDNKVFLYSTEHSPTKPLWRGSMVRAVDATTGAEVWKINDFSTTIAIADGYLVSANNYDNRWYCYGKGQTATSIFATPKVPAKDSMILIEGSVLDQSPAAPGTAAIADAYMKEWTEYLLEQQTKPANATGVEVKLTATDSNCVSQDIGTAISDQSGNYAYSWTPTTEGIYTITASFSGTNSYWSSSAETHIAVGPAEQTQVVTPTPAATETPTMTPTATTTPSAAPVAGNGISTETLLIAGAAVIIVIAVIVAALVLRKRK